MGQVGGTIIGIPKGSPHPEEAWLLVSWMATDTDTLVYMANTVRNVPTTLRGAGVARAGRDAAVPDVPGHLSATRTPTTRRPRRSAQADQDLMASFMEKWQAGKVADLQAGLDQVAKQINDQLVAGAGAVGKDVTIAYDAAITRIAAAGPRARRSARGGVTRVDHGAAVHVAVDHRVHASSSCTRWSRACTSRSRTTTCSGAPHLDRASTTTVYMFTQGHPVLAGDHATPCGSSGGGAAADRVRASPRRPC